MKVKRYLSGRMLERPKGLGITGLQDDKDTERILQNAFQKSAAYNIMSQYGGICNTVPGLEEISFLKTL